MGARQDSRSKRWRIYAPAKLMQRPNLRKSPTENQPSRAAPSSGAGVTADSCRADTYPTGQDCEASSPSLQDGLGLLLPFGAQAPQVFSSTKVLEAARVLEVVQRCYPVVLSGAQVLLFEKLLAREAEAVALRLELNEFEHEAFTAIENEQSLVKASQRLLKQSVAHKHRADAYGSNKEFSS